MLWTSNKEKGGLKLGHSFGGKRTTQQLTTKEKKKATWTKKVVEKELSICCFSLWTMENSKDSKKRNNTHKKGVLLDNTRTKSHSSEFGPFFFWDCCLIFSTQGNCKSLVIFLASWYSALNQGKKGQKEICTFERNWTDQLKGGILSNLKNKGQLT